ncbi:MAG: PspC domain-containing protein [Candidatus Hydrothermia bacterium]|jgi:phage shock protein C
MRKLRRKRTGRVLGGVCAALADYFQIDVSIIRLVMVLLALYSGAGILFYILAWIIIPEEEVSGEEKTDTKDVSEPSNDNTKLLGGILILLLGILILIRNVVGFPPFSMIWPAFLIVLGIWLIIRAFSQK